MIAPPEMSKINDSISPITLSEQADDTERVLPCPVCRGTFFSILLTPDDVAAERRWLEAFRRQRTRGAPADQELIDYTQTKPTFIVRCRACGTLLRDPQPTCEQLRSLYADDTYAPGALAQIAASQDDFFRHKAERMASYLPASATLIEVGSFAGSFLRAARELGWKAVGVDVGDQTSAYTRAAGLEVIQSDIEHAALPLGAWDGVFIWNTFDQVCDPGPVLDRASALLRATGILVLRIPNGEFENGCLQWRRRWRGTRRAERILYAQAHNNFLTFPYLAGYTPTSIGQLLQQHGFTVAAIEGDMVVQLATESTLPFAAREEMRYKRAVSRLCRRLAATTGQSYHPWLDVIARKSAVL